MNFPLKAMSLETKNKFTDENKKSNQRENLQIHMSW